MGMGLGHAVIVQSLGYECLGLDVRYQRHSLVSKYSMCIFVNCFVMILLHNVCYILCGLYA